MKTYVVEGLGLGLGAGAREGEGVWVVWESVEVREVREGWLVESSLLSGLESMTAGKIDS